MPEDPRRTPLKVGIVGAGISGLSAAIALRRTGAEVEIFENSTLDNPDEAGAAITITPNGGRILDSWGFDKIRARGVVAAHLTMMPARTLEASASTVQYVADLPLRFGASMAFYHRADLHAALRGLAGLDGAGTEGRTTTTGGGGDGADADMPPAPAVVLRLGCRVVEVDCEGGVVGLADGTRVRKDLVVVADGVKSGFISTITQNPSPARDMGWSTYRFLVPMSAVRSDPGTASVFGGDADNPGYRVAFDVDCAFYVVTYPCRDSEVLNVVVRHSTTRTTTTQEEERDLHDRRAEEEQQQRRDREGGGGGGWNAEEASREDVLKLVAPYHPALSRLVLLAGEIKSFRLLRRDPLAVYNRGRAVLLGNAAGTVLPTHAQGAVLVIEEAAALEVLFDTNSNDSDSDPDDKTLTARDLVPSRLDLYTALLKRHIHMNQHLSETVPGTLDEPRLRVEELWNRGGRDVVAREKMGEKDDGGGGSGGITNKARNVTDAKSKSQQNGHANVGHESKRTEETRKDLLPTRHHHGRHRHDHLRHWWHRHVRSSSAGGRMAHDDAGPGTQAADVEERELFPREAFNFSPPVRDFFYGYDVRREVRRGLWGAAI